jgi:hypothetical protein
MANAEGGPEEQVPLSHGVIAPGGRFTPVAVALMYVSIIRIDAHDFEPAVQEIAIARMAL